MYGVKNCKDKVRFLHPTLSKSFYAACHFAVFCLAVSKVLEDKAILNYNSFHNIICFFYHYYLLYCRVVVVVWLFCNIFNKAHANSKTELIFNTNTKTLPQSCHNVGWLLASILSLLWKWNFRGRQFTT